MRQYITCFAIISCLWGHFGLYSEDLNLKRNQIFLGPEWYHAKRTKEGGTKQQGDLVGIRGGYDRLKRYGWYFGFDAFTAHGTLKGRSALGSKLLSHLTDASAEARFGYTFQQKEGWQVAFTPFVGGGYFVEENDFAHPSPIKARFRTHYPFGSAGFLSSIYPWACVQIGLNFKVRYPFEPKCNVSNDEDNGPVKQTIKERLQYRGELPITYRLPRCFCLPCGGAAALSLIPFFEYRDYGGHPNFPFNFVKTQYSIWGATLALEYQLYNWK